jgi:predicted Rossmann fold flavoprotein
LKIKNNFDVIVIGGGAAGMMAAGEAAKLGSSTLLIEKTKRCGNKLAITGKGRCNITNTASRADFLKHVNYKGNFLKPAFANIFSDYLIDFFETEGLETIIERGGRVFPKSEKAIDVVRTLEKYCLKNDVTIKKSDGVKSLIVENNTIKGVFAKSGDTILAKKVILATGGASYPLTGSTGDGYKIAAKIGHSIVPIRPILVPLVTKENYKNLSGLNLRNVKISVWIDGKKFMEKFGEMEFTEFGISGAIVLTLSRYCIDFIKDKKNVVFSIDLKPALDEKKLDQRLLRDFNDFVNERFGVLLRKLMPSKLVQVCVQETEIFAEKPANQISAKERKQLRFWLKNFELNIEGHRNFSEAIVTAGGISLKEVNPKTMESKIIKNLFFAGEVLDLDADTGGYNLQIAFSTACLAARNAAKI